MKVKPKEIMVNLPIVLMFDDEDDVLKFASNINTIINGKVKIKYELLGMLNKQHVSIFYLQRHDEFSELREQFVSMIENEEVLEHNRSIIAKNSSSLVTKNGGIECDVELGPCACGAWHEPLPIVKDNHSMSAIEHSRMLFLIDSLLAAPDKALQLIEITHLQLIDYSDRFKVFLTRLEEASGDTASLLNECGKIKLELL